MTALVLLLWALLAHTPSDLSDPWSGWFIALLISALVDMGRS